MQTKMNPEQLPPILVNFLKENGYYNKYISQAKLTVDHGIGTNLYWTPFCGYFFTIWSETVDGYAYWAEVETKWTELLDNSTIHPKIKSNSRITDSDKIETAGGGECGDLGYIPETGSLSASWKSILFINSYKFISFIDKGILFNKTIDTFNVLDSISKGKAKNVSPFFNEVFGAKSMKALRNNIVEKSK